MNSGSASEDIRSTKSTDRRLMLASALLVLAFLVIAAFSLLQARLNAEHEAQRKAQDLTRVLDRYVYSIFHEVDLALQFSSREVEHLQTLGGSRRANEISLFLVGVKQQLPHALDVRATNPEGQVVYGTNLDASVGVNLSDRPYFRRARDSQGSVISPPVVSRLNHQWVMPVARRYMTPDGKFGGIVFVTIQAAQLRALFASLNADGDGVITMFDESAAIYLRYPEADATATAQGPLIRLQSPEFLAAWRSNQREGSFRATSSVDGRVRTLSYRQVGDLPLYVSVGLAQSDYLQPWRQQLAYTACILFFLAAATIVLTKSTGRALRLRRESIDALTERQSQLQAIFENTPVANLIVQLDGLRIQKCNQVACRILGYSEIQLCNMTLHDLDFRSPEHPDVQQVVQEFLAGMTDERELSMRRPDQQQCVMGISLSRYSQDDGGVLIVALQDRTATHRAQRALMHSEARFHDFSRSSADWFWETGDDHALRYFSTERNRLQAGEAPPQAGLPLAESLRLLEHNPPGVVAQFDQVLAAHREFRDFECRIGLENSAVRWVSLSAVPVWDGQQFIGYRGVGKDITVQKQAQQSAAESMALLQEAIEEVSSGFTIYDADDRLVMCNRRYRDLHLSSSDEILPGRTFEEIVRLGAQRGQYLEARGEDLEDWVAQRVQQHRNAAGVPVKQKLDNGRSLLIIENRTPSGYIVGNRVDITDLVTIEDRLAKLSLAVEQSAESIIITDTDANIEYVNEAFVRTTGYTRTEALGRNARFLKSGRTPQQTYVELWGALTEGRPWQGTLLNRRKSGEVYPEHVYVTPIREERGAVTHYLAIREDITEKQRTEAALRQYQENLEELVVQRTRELHVAKDAAEGSARAKSAFLANMSHEIRTPMNAIVGMTELCLATDLSAAQQNYLSKIRMAADALLGVISDILDYSKIDAGMLSIESIELDLRTVYERVDALLSEQARRKGLTLAFEFDPELDRVLVGDPFRLGQILLNLVGNAIKFSDKGSIVVAMRQLFRKDNDVVVNFSVRDQGIGIPADKTDRLFSSFSQADVSTTRKYGGTGLGLAISKSLVELMHGEIWVDSVEGEGSNFQFTIPFQASAAQAEAFRLQHASQQSTDPAALSDLAAADILLVEDVELNQEVIVELLGLSGIRVRVANHGEEALQAVAEKVPDFVLMDCQMPVMDGYEATRRLRQDPRYAALPIVALTAYSLESEHQRCAEAGMNGLISKPIQLGALHEVLRRHLDKQALSGQDARDTVPAPADAATRVPVLPGIDTAQGLALVGGRVAFYYRVLKKFRATQGLELESRLEAAIAATDWPEAGRLLHSMAGLAASIGALRLATLARDLEAALRQSDTRKLHEKAGRVYAALDQVVCSIDTWQMDDAADATGAGDVSVEATLRTLGMHLKNQDADAIDCLKVLQALIGNDPTYVPLLLQIESAMGRYDYSAALAPLEALRRQRAGDSPDTEGAR